MSMIEPLKCAALLSACLGSLIVAMPIGWAQTGQVCESDGNFEAASETHRIVELPEFGIQIKIPSNYRTMKRQDGSARL